MKKTFTLLLFLISLSIYAQSTLFGGISGLAYRKNNVKAQILATDTLQDRLMNYHLIHYDFTGSLLKKVNLTLNKPSIFFVSNKFGGDQRKVYAKIGSSVVTSLGIEDIPDSLNINSTQLNSKILTFTKSDVTKKINPIIFLNKRTDKKLLTPEILVFDNILSDIDLQKIETYLSIKYGITINNISEKNYISSTNEIIWDSKKNKNYNFRITGVGRDDIYDLYQKQSINSNDYHIAMAIDSLKLTNNFNAGNLDNGSFLLWGDNNQELKFKDMDLLSQHPKRDMSRMWKIQNKTVNNQILKTNVYAVLPIQPTGNTIKLRLFRTDSEYQNDTSIDVLGKKINDTLYVFKDVLWDTDKDKTDYFTFTLNDIQSDVNVQLTSTCTDLGNNIIKISTPQSILPFQYSLLNINTNQTIFNNVSATTNEIIFNNLNPDNYKLIINKPGYNDIIRTFDLQGIINQNINSNYLWQGTPIELDLNTSSFQYTLTNPNGQTTSAAPYFLNGTGNYQLLIKNKLGCEITKTVSVLSQSEYDALQSTSLFKKITVSPNPSHDGNLTVKVELKIARPIHIKIFNSLGVLIKQGEYNSSADFTIPMNIPAVVGYYNIKIFIPEEGKGVNFLIN